MTRINKVGQLVEDIGSLILCSTRLTHRKAVLRKTKGLCSTRLPPHKAVSEKDTRPSQHKAASHNFRLPHFVSNVLFTTFCRPRFVGM